jgi:uncharacterized protein YhaN
MAPAKEKANGKSKRGYSEMYLGDAIGQLSGAIEQFRKTSEAHFAWYQSHVGDDFTTKQKKRLEEFVARVEGAITRAKKEIMSQADDAIAQFKTEVEEFAKGIEKNVDKVATSVSGIDTDVKWLKEKLAALPTGDLSAAAKADLKAIKDRFGGLAQKTTVLAQLVTTLDEATDSSEVPTAPPTEPPTEPPVEPPPTNLTNK